MTKQEMLDKLGTNETEWDSYLVKISKFMNEDLNDSERDLHQRIFSKMTLAIFPSEGVSSQDISELYEAQRTLLSAVFTSQNICKRFLLIGEIE